MEGGWERGWEGLKIVCGSDNCKTGLDFAMFTILKHNIIRIQDCANTKEGKQFERGNCLHKNNLLLLQKGVILIEATNNVERQSLKNDK